MTLVPAGDHHQPAPPPGWGEGDATHKLVLLLHQDMILPNNFVHGLVTLVPAGGHHPPAPLTGWMSLLTSHKYLVLLLHTVEP